MRGALGNLANALENMPALALRELTRLLASGGEPEEKSNALDGNEFKNPEWIDNQGRPHDNLELREIETLLREHGSIEKAVIVWRKNRTGHKRPVVYAAPADAIGADVDQLRAHLRQYAPEYMIPSTYVLLKALPLTPDGDVDRQALPTPENGTVFHGDYVAPRTPLEKVLVAIWADVLKLSRVGVHDNFFELGGHSLLAIRALSLIRSELHINCELRLLFEWPSVSELARRLDETIRSCSADNLQHSSATPNTNGLSD
jgi:hypothetical protein